METKRQMFHKAVNLVVFGNISYNIICQDEDP